MQEEKRVNRNNETDASEEHDSTEDWSTAVSPRKKNQNDSPHADQRPESQILSGHGADLNIPCKKYVKRHQAKKTTKTLTEWNKSEVTPEMEATTKVINPIAQEERLLHFKIV